MIQFNAVIKKFDKQGDKTGWSYFDIPEEMATQLKPGYKKSFRVKGKLDSYKIEGKSLLPIGSGNFIMPVDAAIRKALGKRTGAVVTLNLSEDIRKVEINKTFLICLADEPDALKFFNSLPGSHRNYFSKWIESAKTAETKANRMARAVTALSRKQSYPEMIRAGKDERLM